jgi:hypothetical protein
LPQTGTQAQASPILVSVLLARFVPKSVAVAYATWAAHVEKVQDKAEVWRTHALVILQVC